MTKDKESKKKQVLVSMTKDGPVEEVTTKKQKEKFAHLELDN